MFHKGIRRPDWYGAALQQVEFLEAWSVSDVFADGELLIAAFKRGKDRYAFTATVANNAQGTVVEVLLVDPVDLPDILAEIRAEFSEGPEGVFSLDRLEAGELRRRLEPAVRETLVDDEDDDEYEDPEEAEDDAEDSLEQLDEEFEDDPELQPEAVDEAFAELDALAALEQPGPAAADTEAHGYYEEFDEHDEDEEDEGDDFAALRALMLSRLAVLPEPAELPGGTDIGYDLDDLPPLLDEFTSCEDVRGLPHPAIVREWGEVFARLGLTEFAGDPPLYGPGEVRHPDQRPDPGPGERRRRAAGDAGADRAGLGPLVHPALRPGRAGRRVLGGGGRGELRGLPAVLRRSGVHDGPAYVRLHDAVHGGLPV